MRGSDPHATLYWLARMLYAGEDPGFVSRRIMIHAAEDVGLADPQALVVAAAPRRQWKGSACPGQDYTGGGRALYRRGSQEQFSDQRYRRGFRCC
jgi:hypothetical protein